MTAPDAPRIVVGVGAVVVHDGRLLMVKRGQAPAKDTWAVPGGKVEVGEPLHQAVLRELREETGLDGEITGPCGMVERIGPGHHLIIHDYWVRVGSPGDARAGDDAAALAWMAVADLAAAPLAPGMMDFLTEHDVTSLLR